MAFHEGTFCNFRWYHFEMGKRAGGLLPAGVLIDRRAPRALDQQLYAGLRAVILAGDLAPGARLPSSRSIARDLALSRNTVLSAFDRLLAEGYVTARVGSGTRVNAALPDHLLQAPAPDADAAPRRAAAAAHRPALASNAAAVLRVSTSISLLNDRIAPFRFGSPDVNAFPLRIWARLEQVEWRRARARDLEYGDPAGLPQLRRAIAAHLRSARAARCAAEQIIVLASAQQALDLTARLLLEPGEPVWLEDPGYLGARAAFLGSGARIVPVPVDADGLCVEQALRAAPSARAAYVTPSNQFPTGTTLSLPRRLALLDWAARRRRWIIEDDYDSEFRYATRPLACLQGMDAAERVIHIGTFSKSLCPGVRLAFLVAPPALVDAFRSLRSWSDGHSPALAQRVLARFIDEGHYERHLRAMRVAYGERRDALIAAVARTLPEHIQMTPPDGGLHGVGWLRGDGVKAAEVARAAAARGVDLAPLAAFRLRPGGREGLLFGFAPFAPRELAVALRTLVPLFRK
jgi:GntR family transcriptional regulator/MocR family aminotransferase